MQNELHGSLGLAQRAGRVCSGQDVVREALDAGKVFLLLLASDAAPRTYNEFTRLANQKMIPWRQPGMMREYGAALGKPDRAVVAVLDQGFASSMLRKIDQAIQRASSFDAPEDRKE